MTEDPKVPPFAFGQTVFCPEASAYADHMVPCPICFGQKFATLILGNGERQEVECDACRRGFGSPSGTFNEHRVASRVDEGCVTGMQWDKHHERWRVEVDGRGRNEVFASREVAEAMRAAMHEDCEAQRVKMFESNMLGHKQKLTWSAHYHRTCLAEARRKVAYHEGKLSDPRIRERKVKP